MGRNTSDLKVDKLYYTAPSRRKSRKIKSSRKNISIAPTPSPQPFSLTLSKLSNTSDS